MQCHSCGTDVRDGQKFCMECGTSLRGVADVTGEVPVVRAATPPPDADATAPVRATPPPPPEPAVTSAPSAPRPGDDTTRLPVLAGATMPRAEPSSSTVTSDFRVVEATTAPVSVIEPTGDQPAWPGMDAEPPANAAGSGSGRS